MLKKLDFLFEKLRNQKCELHKQLYLFDKDRLYLTNGHSSLFDYLVHHAGLSESEAYEFNIVVKMMNIEPEMAKEIRVKHLTLATLKAIRPLTSQVMTLEDKRKVIREAYNCQPQEAVQKIQREFPLVKVDSFSKRMTLFFDQEMDLLFEKVKNQMSHQYPNGVRLNNAVSDSWKFYLSRKQSSVNTNIDSQNSMAALKRFVWSRAKAQCEFIAKDDGRRCMSKYLLQIDHVIPKSRGGQDEASNLRLLCANHNKHESMLRQKRV